jgi:biopolymer transport protein ExbB
MGVVRDAVDTALYCGVYTVGSDIFGICDYCCFLIKQTIEKGVSSMEWLHYVVDYGVIGFLLLMSVVVVAIAIERKMLFRRTRIESYRDKRQLELDLTRHLHLIATVGSNAPYIGLLGTVLGIMLTFATIGKNGIADATAIMTGLALALKATALGLVVAIPAVILYNLLLRSVKELLLRWEIEYGREKL